MTDDLVVIHKIVDNRAVKRDANFGRIPNRSQRPGWLVSALFVRDNEGDPACVEYRVRAVPDTHDMNVWHPLLAIVGDNLTGQHRSLPTPVPTPGGIPRYVYEEASQAALLADARAKAGPGSVHAISPATRQFLLSGPVPGPGRPSTRGYAEKLRLIAIAADQITNGARLQDVADALTMSRSALRDLLSWARNDAEPRLLHRTRQGQGGAVLTPAAHDLLREIESDPDA